MNKIDKIEKSRKNDSYALLYCKGKKGLEKLIKICGKNSSDFWIVEICPRKNKAKFNKIWDRMFECFKRIENPSKKI